MNPPLPAIVASDERPPDGYSELHPSWLDDTIREIRAVAARVKASKLTPIKPHTQQLAAAILAGIEADSIPIPYVDYYLPAGLCFVWEVGDRELEIVINRNGSVSARKRLNGEITFYQHRPTPRDVTPFIRRAIDWCHVGYARTQTAEIETLLSRGLNR
jgi:hypothetical protein